MDSSTIPLLLLLGVVFPVAVIGANCTSKIQIFEGEKEVNISDSECVFFGTDSCKDGSQKLPNNLGIGDSVDKPRNFSTQIFVSNYQYNGITYAAPGVIFTWQVPLSGTSRQYTKGYWLEMKEVQSAAVLCRVIDLSGYNLSLTTSFQLKLFPLIKQFTTSYIVQLYSLPPPSQEEMNEELYAQSVASFPAYKQLNGPLYPDQWTTWINIERDPKGGSVKVTFGFANISFAFEQYKLRLYSFNESRSIDETFVPQVHTKTVGEYTFQNIPAGMYNVSVRPEDTYPNTPNCLCYSRFESYGRMCSTCTTSWTSEFEIKAGLPFSSTDTPTSTSDSPKTYTAGPPDPHTSPFTSTTTSNSTNETYIGLIVGAVLGGVIFFAVAILFVFWICTQRKDPSKYKFDEPGKNDAVTIVAVPFPNTDFKTRDQDPPPIRIRKVFLLAADDHVYHTQAVERFADFLHVHCQADVSFAPQCLSEIHGKNTYCWLAAKIEESDNVLIVASKGAQCLYQAFLKGLAYKRENFGPEGDLFTPGIQHICGMIARNVDVHKILTVHFEYTSSDCCLPIAALPSSVYLLPKHLSSLVQHIHKLTKNMDLTKVNLPLECNIGDLPEGSQWMDAVQKAKAFEQQHVNWLSDKFKNPEETVKCNPPYISQESGFYSDTGSIHSRHSTGSERRLSSASRYPEGCVSDLDCFTPDDFIEPSVYSVYTVVPAHGYEQEELDDGGSFLTEQMKRINQRYENYLHGGQDLFPAETESGVCQQMHLLNAVNEAAWGQGVHSQDLNSDYEELDSISVLSAQSV